tara:strand:+ start:842 stop:1264 length:423 start_codon:yes stop_codon:yes gene_type:complete
LKIFQETIEIKNLKRGIHLITHQIIESVSDLKLIEKGTMHLFLQHTSASLTINENFDQTVRKDMIAYFNKIVPEQEPYFKHNFEGDDDMPAHIKSTMIGNELTIPITNGSLNLGTWQGIYLCEHRNDPRKRNIVVTIFGF